MQLNGGALPAATNLTLQDSSYVGGNDAVFDLNGNNQTVAGVFNNDGGGGLGSFITNSGGNLAALTVTVSGNFSGTIGANTTGGTTGQGPGGNNIALVMSGAGTLTLGGLSTYSGGTTVSNGTLRTTIGGVCWSHGGALGTGPLGA